MLAKTYSYGINGLDAYPICIEVDASRGLPITSIVGLPDNAVRESRERVRAAIRNSGLEYAKGRVTINLSPADVKKEGPAFDLPIAIGLLQRTEQINIPHLNEFIMIGELSLDGKLQPIKGALSIALNCSPNIRGIILPYSNGNEALLAKRVPVYPAKTLQDVISILQNYETIKPAQLQKDTYAVEHHYELDFQDVKGQWHVKRGLEVAAAGMHNFLLIGPPGSGKSMLAKRITSILPAMSRQEALETTQIHSVTGLLTNTHAIITQRPFRSPHHTTSSAAIVGGGSNPRPGEVTLSHNGVLFLDEFPEFKRDTLESLRQPMEDHYVTIARANRTLRFPAQFMLACAMNPSPLGAKETTGAYQNQKYLSKISGPILDRIDIHLDVPPVKPNELFKSQTSETSAEIRKRTIQAHQIQKERFKNTNIRANAYMGQKEIKKYCALNQVAKILLKNAIDQLNLSARGYDKILKVARTVADLEGEENILEHHLAEAIQYRTLDRNW